MDKVWQGAGLRRTRMLAGRSIAEVAAEMRVTESAVTQWELGMTSPRGEQLRALAAYYGMPLDTLLYEIGAAAEPASMSLRDWYAQHAAGRISRPRPGGARKVKGTTMPGHSGPAGGIPAVYSGSRHDYARALR